MIAVVIKSIMADITAPAVLISPSNKLRTGAAICQMPNRIDEKAAALIKEYLVSYSQINNPRKIPSSITTLIRFPITQKAKNNRPVCLP